MTEDEKKIVNEGAEIPLVYTEDGALLPSRQPERTRIKRAGAELPPLKRKEQASKDVPNSIRRILGG